jgi:hypothetical protein
VCVCQCVVSVPGRHQQLVEATGPSHPPQRSRLRRGGRRRRRQGRRQILAHILKSQGPSVFIIESDYTMELTFEKECRRHLLPPRAKRRQQSCDRHSQTSVLAFSNACALVQVTYKVTIKSTFEKVCLARLLMGLPLTPEKEPATYKTRPRRARAMTQPLPSTTPMLCHALPSQAARLPYSGKSQ